MTRFAVLRAANFRSFLVGYTTSALGTAMAGVALSFAVLHGTGSLRDLSFVLAARIVPMVLFLLFGGVLGDRFPRRIVMLSADSVRALSQGGLALAFMAGTPTLWLMMTLAAFGGLGEAVFRPSYDGLAPSLVPAAQLPEANALLGLANSTTNVAGPALAGVLLVFLSPAAILLIDAISYVPSIVILLYLRIDSTVTSGSSVLKDLRTGWRTFCSYPWLWTITLQFTLFNLLVWGPYLVLGPASADRHYGGASAWGLVVALYGGGSVIGSLLLMGRRPRRPLIVAVVATYALAMPSATLALRAPLAVVCVAALVAGCGSAIFNTLYLTTVQQRVPPEALSRVMSYIAFGAYSVGPVGLALAGPISDATSISAVLTVGVGWQLVATSAVLAVPAVRRLRRDRPVG
ncbi:MFS transporter [Actinocrispum wychmicini]|uniref:Putative MFS family arabinose efflux permease n=1 Tax=Actinocrispum wychmicini TaxID=1213861 RepID=A0A4R2JKZ3_9PSEU|nr:MFS transporter [Actinocrispum wychmicini]TCO60713.1 putative MFS family arabinose efflux permease [Actinocrispum wychmicini]